MISPAPKREPTPKKPRKELQAKKWGVSDKPRKPLAQVNLEQEKRRRARRAKQRRSQAEQNCRRDAWDRANGHCECGKCGRLPFDKTFGQYHPDYPEFHHDQYEDPMRNKAPRGRYVRRGCHHLLEMTEHPTRKHGKAA